MRKQLTIIGTNHGKAVSRIWIEGKRLVEAGFTVGLKYTRTTGRTEDGMDYIKLTLDREGNYKVSGKGDKPIIDTSGKVVRDVFPDSGDDTSKQVVEVLYGEGVITIQRPTE